MSSQGLPKIKYMFVAIFVVMAIIGIICAYNFLFPKQVDIKPITEGQTQLSVKLNELITEVNNLKSEINQLNENTASKSDIQTIESRLAKIDNEIANIEPQAVQNIDLLNMNTYINNYNIRIIFSVTIALIILESLKVTYNKWKKKRKSEYGNQDMPRK